MTLISVILPNYNHAAFLEQRIQSILSQTYTNFELIILDDASTDNSKAIIETYQSHEKLSHIIYNDTNSGSPFLQWQKGIALAKGEWIWIAESDDTALPGFLSAVAAMAQQNPGAGICYCDAAITDAGGTETGKASAIRNAFFETQKWSGSYAASGTDELNDCLKYLCTINNASASIFRKELFLSLQEDIIRYRYFGDWYFYIRAALQSHIVYSSEVLAAYRNHPGNFASSRGTVIETRKEYYIILQYLLKQDTVTEKKKLVRFFSLHYLGTGWKKEGPGNVFKTFRQYFRINRRLALQTIPQIIWYKLIGKKNRREYP